MNTDRELLELAARAVVIGKLRERLEQK